MTTKWICVRQHGIVLHLEKLMIFNNSKNIYYTIKIIKLHESYTSSKKKVMQQFILTLVKSVFMPVP